MSMVVYYDLHSTSHCLPAAPSSPPEQFNASASSSSTLLLRWNPPSISSVNGIIQYYNVIIVEQETDTIVQSTTTTSTQLLVFNLHPYYIYICSVTAVTIGSGPFVNVTIQMPEDGKCQSICYYRNLFTYLFLLSTVPASAPTSIEAPTITSTSVEITWDSLPSEDENGIIRYYVINVTVVQTGTQFQTTSTGESVVLSSLHPAYTYTVTVAAYTVGEGPRSNTFTFQTLEDGESM